MPRQSLRLWALLLAASFACGCFATASTVGSRLPRQLRFVDEWSHYERLSPNKAMAVAGDPSTFYVSGYAFGYTDESAAVEAAMAACEQRRIDRRVTAACQPYAVGNQRLAGSVVPPITRR